MVYAGPSKGCMACRSRKIKCDETKPACQRCKRTNRKCPGYEVKTFRDQTQLTKERALLLRSQSVPTRVEKPEAQESGIWTPAVPKRSLPQCFEQQALYLFMNYYVTNARHQETPDGPVAALPQLYAMSESNSALRIATSALATAHMTWRTGRADFRLASISRYAEAVRVVNEAIQDPEQSQTDGFLQTVLLLGLWEKRRRFLGLPESRADAHIKGATALLKVRAQQPSMSEPSMKLFVAVREQLIDACILKSEFVPLLDDFVSCTNETSQALSSRMSFGDRLVTRLVGIPGLTLRAKSLLGSPHEAEKHAELQELVENAKAMESSIATTWCDQVPPGFDYTSKWLCQCGESNSPHGEDVYPKRLDMYHDAIVANTWNRWRTARIHLLVIIMQCASATREGEGPLDNVPDYVDAMTKAQILVDDVCSSVPYTLQNLQDMSDYPHAAGATIRLKQWKTADPWFSFLLMQHLKIASEVVNVPETQRQWMKEYLARISEDPRTIRDQPLGAAKV